MSTPYKDVQHLDREGEWPGLAEPEWVVKMMEASDHPMRLVAAEISAFAYEEHISRLSGQMLGLRMAAMNVVTTCAQVGRAIAEGSTDPAPLHRLGEYAGMLHAAIQACDE